MLCTECETLFHSEWNIGDDGSVSCLTAIKSERAGDGVEHQLSHAHHKTISAFQRSSQSGCRLCGALFNTLFISKKAHSFWGKGKLDNLKEDIQLFEGLGYRLLIDWREASKFGTSCCNVVRLWLDLENLVQPRDPLLEFSDCSDPATFKEILASPSTGSQDVIKQIRAWCTACDDTHEWCRLSRPQDRFVPTRVLDVGKHNSTSESQYVRLVLGSKLPITARYVTLSHQWGGMLPVRLTSLNYNELFSGFDEHRLPPSFYHAVTIARELGARYVWIDSLCIIQGSDQASREDWMKEAPRMDQVYRGSYINLVAADASNCMGGLFSDRDITKLFPVVVKQNALYTTLQGDILEQKDVVIRDPFSLRSELHNAPVHQRAWVLQERMLSIRALNFTSSRVYWECAERLSEDLDTCPVYSIEEPDIERSWTFYSTKHEFDRTFSKRKTELSAQAGYNLWHKLIQTYMSCLLSFPSDKLVAMSGLGKFIGELIQDEYIAGLWRSELPLSLLWIGPGPDSIISLSSSYRAPSWSWAAWDLRPGVEQNFGRFDQDWKAVLCDVLEAKVKTSDPTNPFGPVTSAYMHLSVPYASANASTVKSFLSRYHRDAGPHKAYTIGVESGSGTQDSSSSHTADFVLQGPWTAKYKQARMKLDDEPSADDRLHFLVIATGVSPRIKKDIYQRNKLPIPTGVFGVILCENQGQNNHRRVGYWSGQLVDSGVEQEMSCKRKLTAI